jgi:hypothetical protein
LGTGETAAIEASADEDEAETVAPPGTERP